MIVRIAVKIQKHVLKDRNAWGLVTAKIDTRKAVSGLQVAKANRAVENEVRGSPDGVGVSSGVHDQLLAEPAMCEQFVGLLCQFEPAAVLAFLQSHDRCVSHTSTGLPDLPLGRHVWPYQTFSLI